MQHNQGQFSTNGVAREPRTKLDNQELARKPRSGLEIKKYEDNQEMSHGWIQRHTRAKFSKRVLKIFEGKQFYSRVAISIQCKEDRGRNPGFRISMYCSTLGQNFSIFEKLKKFIQHYTLGQIFPILLKKKKNQKNSKSHLNGPREGVRPKIC